MSALAVREVATLAEVPRPDWNRLVPSEAFYQSHEWLSGQEGDPVISVVYLLVHDGPTLVGGLPLYGFRRSRRDDYRQRFEHDADLLFAGPRSGYRSQLLADPALQAEALLEVRRALLTRAMDAALERGFAGLTFDYLTGAGLAQLASVADVVATFRAPEAEIDTGGRGSEAFLRSLGRQMRHNMEKEMRRFARAGWDVRIERLATCRDELVQPLVNLHRKHGDGLEPETVRDFLTRQAPYLEGCDVVFTCRDDDGRLASYALLFEWIDTLYGRIVGFDYPLLRDAFEYFNLAYYQPLRYMDDRGLRKLHLGLTAVQAKGRRGASFHPLWSAALLGRESLRRPGLRWVRPSSAHDCMNELQGMLRSAVDPSEWRLL